MFESLESVLSHENVVSICDANQMKVFALYLILGWKYNFTLLHVARMNESL